MQANLGNMIKNAREKRGLTRLGAAKKLGCSEAYVSFLERNRPVHLSEDLANRLINRIGVKSGIKGLIEAQNARARRYYLRYKKRHNN